jgi:colanic acid biosynthesis glycosyl transferase WcaI
MTEVRVLVHDYAGHVAQVQVSRELARRGYRVLHLYAAGLQTPRGALQRRPDDPETFSVAPVTFTKKFQKHNYFRRQLQEVAYAWPLTRAVTKFRPDVVLSANTPLLPQAKLEYTCRRAGIPFIVWMTDVYSLAVSGGIGNSFGWLGSAIKKFYSWLDRYLLRHAQGVIVISEKFKQIVDGWSIGNKDVRVIPVCAPFDELSVGAKDNEWSRGHGLSHTRNIIYSGTLGTKHNPSLLAALADRLRDQSDVRVIVVSEGTGADYLAKQKQEHGLDNLILLPYQPFDRLSEVFASADILLAILERDAADYSIPSKVLSQLCASRPQVVAVPSDNVAAQLIVEAGAGLIVPPTDEEKFIGAVLRLLDDPDQRMRMGELGRSYAERELGVHHLVTDYIATIQDVLMAAKSTEPQTSSVHLGGEQVAR